MLGTGWTGTFLLPLLASLDIPHAHTTSDGRDNSIAFRFDPSSLDPAPFRWLPKAQTVLIVFPLRGEGQSNLLTSLYESVHGAGIHWIQLGSSGIFNKGPTLTGEPRQYDGTWSDRNSPYDKSNPRAIAEDELINEHGGAVLNLVGLYGGPRDPKHWVPRIAKSKADVASKQSVHLVHGEDVARAIVAAHRRWSHVQAARWIVGDLRVYDWWDLFMSWGAEFETDDVAQAPGTAAPFPTKATDEATKHRHQLAKWVGELMREQDVHSLPRDSSRLGRLIDARDFWAAVGVWPAHGRVC